MADESQAEIGQNLTRVLSEVNLKFDKIKSVNSAQVQMAQDLEKSFSKMTASLQSMNGQIESNIQAFDRLSKNLNNLFGFFVRNDITNAFSEIAKTSTNSTNRIKKNYSQMQKQNAGNTKSLSKYLSQSNKVFNRLNNSFRQASNETNNLITSMQNVDGEISRNVSLQKDLRSSIEDLAMPGGSISNRIKSVLGGALSFMKNVTISIVNFVKLSATIPFTVAKAGADIGNALRSDIVETIGNAGEGLKEFFDTTSYVGRGLQEMVADSTGLLKEFQKPNSELVRLFGFGTAGIVARVNEVGKNINAMGHFSEIFGRSITGKGNEKNLAHFVKLTRAFGYTESDLAYFAQDAAVNLEHVNDRMHRAGMITKETANAYNIDM